MTILIYYNKQVSKFIGLLRKFQAVLLWPFLFIIHKVFVIPLLDYLDNVH